MKWQVIVAHITIHEDHLAVTFLKNYNTLVIRFLCVFVKRALIINLVTPTLQVEFFRFNKLYKTDTCSLNEREIENFLAKLIRSSRS